MSSKITFYLEEEVLARLDAAVSAHPVHRDRSAWARDKLPILLNLMEVDLEALARQHETALKLSRHMVTEEGQARRWALLNQFREALGLDIIQETDPNWAVERVKELAANRRA